MTHKLRKDGLIGLRIHWSVLVLFILVVIIGSLPQITQAQDDQRCFPETNLCISGRIREYWEQNGGLPVFGFPITPQREEIIEGQPLQVQWFERNRLELHPENARPYDVLLGRLSTDLLKEQGRDWNTFPKGDATDNGEGSCHYFEQTDQYVCGDILAMWQANGLEMDGVSGFSYEENLALFGLPLSGQVQETLEDGNTYTVQWFERARFELHPEHDPPYNVLLGLLGNLVGPPDVSGTPTLLEIGIKGEELAFDTDTLEATIAEGEELTVVFENTSQTQEHSWVLLNHNDMDRAETFNDAAARFVDAKYIPIHDAALMDMVLAYSPAIQPGESNTITFSAPRPGEYLYICTVPGHFAAGDYGVLTIYPDMADVDVILEIGIKGEELAFDTDTLDATIAEGEKMAVVFENTSQTQEHSWVLFNHADMDRADAFNDAAVRFVDANYIPIHDAALMDMVLAYSPAIQPGESNTITFSAPRPGEYLYICTVPGHFAAGDYGVLTISAP